LSALFAQLGDWIAQHPGWAGGVVFAVALTESLAIVGVLVPGVAILFGAGALIGNGTLDFWTIFLWTLAGAILGDNLSFWLGHYYEDRFANSRWFRLHPQQLQRGMAFIHRHGAMSIAIGRFFGPLRAVVPLAAGLLRMQPGHFFIANLLSALVWAPAYLLPGMLFGASLEQSAPVSLRLTLILLLLAGALFGVFKLLRRGIASPALCYGLSGLVLCVPLMGLHLYMNRDIGALEPTGQTLPYRHEPPAHQGWQDLPARRPIDMLKWLSPETPISELPLPYRLAGHRAWVRPLDAHTRELYLMGDNTAWQMRERISDFLLFRLPLAQP
jgi:membrane protein DedA with SNARE-associated domain